MHKITDETSNLVNNLSSFFAEAKSKTQKQQGIKKLKNSSIDQLNTILDTIENEKRMIVGTEKKTSKEAEEKVKKVESQLHTVISQLETSNNEKMEMGETILNLQRKLSIMRDALSKSAAGDTTAASIGLATIDKITAKKNGGKLELFSKHGQLKNATILQLDLETTEDPLLYRDLLRKKKSLIRSQLIGNNNNNDDDKDAKLEKEKKIDPRLTTVFSPEFSLASEKDPIAALSTMAKTLREEQDKYIKLESSIKKREKLIKENADKNTKSKISEIMKSATLEMKRYKKLAEEKLKFSLQQKTEMEEKYKNELLLFHREKKIETEKFEMEIKNLKLALEESQQHEMNTKHLLQDNKAIEEHYDNLIQQMKKADSEELKIAQSRTRRVAEEANNTLRAAAEALREAKEQHALSITKLENQVVKAQYDLREALEKCKRSEMREAAALEEIARIKKATTRLPHENDKNEGNSKNKRIETSVWSSSSSTPEKKMSQETNETETETETENVVRESSPLTLAERGRMDAVYSWASEQAKLIPFPSPTS
eukprot:g6510.t1